MGATGGQMLSKVQLPLARRTIGIGAQPDDHAGHVDDRHHGADRRAGPRRGHPPSALRNDVGPMFDAGVAVVILAIILDRLTEAPASGWTRIEAARSGPRGHADAAPVRGAIAVAVVIVARLLPARRVSRGDRQPARPGERGRRLGPDERRVADQRAQGWLHDLHPEPARDGLHDVPGVAAPSASRSSADPSPACDRPSSPGPASSSCSSSGSGRTHEHPRPGPRRDPRQLRHRPRPRGRLRPQRPGRSGPCVPLLDVAQTMPVVRLPAAGPRAVRPEPVHGDLRGRRVRRAGRSSAWSTSACGACRRR